MNPSAHLGTKFNGRLAFKTILTALDVWSALSFYVFFFITLNWYVFYKWAESATVLLPSAFQDDSIYPIFTGFFIAIWVSKTIVVLMKIRDQANVDIFILDWERSRLPEYSPLNAVGLRPPQEDNAPIFWRSCFVANELNEL
jgi:hypothetical protein